ncbi:hypothetical protein [Acetivibrio clariflavus]|uniref:Uncharacterized protein n=1 Tax=Acetivibrio clariflavus (strain DSM 19732 / NBRC 101661 / EBR45) TaxID=720554 RepID=G8LWH4_ACECE|nr:hypothetical protein [Acetivibrio clariflavus]AEV67600.1 hypothetical protein Clocl_0922 [Acetivibrio clariflavus DSM 19732]HPU41781.1 hypothetical protein [Acetivibrio clariflavus]
MAFINEKISEADKEIFNSYGFKSVFTNDPIEPWEWTIDRERDIFLVALEGRGYYDSEIPLFYALVWQKRVIKIEAYRKSIGDFFTGTEMYWRITKIEAPMFFFNQKDELIELIKEAFDAHGSLGRRDIVTKVNFDYIAEPYFIMEMNK